MANPDKAPTLVPQLTSTQEIQAEDKDGVGGAGEQKPAPPSGTTPVSVVADPSPPSDAHPPAAQPPPPLSSTAQQPSPILPAAPHPKKFSAVNINKKFLEKTSATGSAPSSSASSATKAGSPVSRPSPQASISHSRLVTTKLTATPSVSTSTAGWSRPSSVAPSPAATGANSPGGASPLPAAATLATTTPSAPQLPHAGKVIQPIPRATVLQQTASQKDGASGKPVWGNVKPPPATSPARPDITPDDFPTAAEVAQVSARKQKSDEAKAATEEVAAAASKQARMEEADTFRGVHLDPNAHHWDEMEEDDDNFLGGVIEFEDGRQYKVEAAESTQPAPPRQGDGPTVPVSKEERFVDDFDRSWPRSRTSPALSTRDVPPPQSVASPASSTTVLHSPQESSRVLFNERSNRLEPYAHGHRPGPNQYPPKRGSFQESSSNVQLLQKPGGAEFPSRNRGFSGAREPGLGAGPFGDRQRGERDFPPRRDGPPPSPRLPRDGFTSHAMGPSASLSGRDRDLNMDRGRRTTMGPPPLPSHTLPRTSHESERQLPPHLVSPGVPARRLPSRDSHLPEPPLSAGPSGPMRHPSQSPALSHASAAIVSPVATSPVALPQLSPPDLDVVRKDVMHSAATRAKQRREQEEAEREAQKERARRKAAELEEKMKAAEAEKTKLREEEEAAKKEKEETARRKEEAEIAEAKEKEAVSLIEDALKSAQPPVKSVLHRPPSLKGVSSRPESARPDISRRTAGPANIRGPLSAPPAPSQSTQTESWRSKASPLPAPPLRQVPSSAHVPTFTPPPPSALEQVGVIAEGASEDLEVVDFSDMGKFVGAPEPAKDGKATVDVGAKANRPVASDFFDDAVPVPEAKSDFGVWRRKAVHEVQPQTDVDASVSDTVTKDASTSTRDIPMSAEGSHAVPTTSHKEIEHQGSQVVTVPAHLGHQQRTPRNQASYKEATMSALDDAMSRIKGALDASKETHPSTAVSDADEALSKPVLPPPPSPAKPALPKDRWVPPALRPRIAEYPDDPREVFDVTGIEPPRSPKPAWNSFLVRLPKVSHPLEPPNRRQLIAFSRPTYQVRWDILSFDPPVEGMSRREFSLNDILFRKQPGGYKGKPKYRVLLPRVKPFQYGPRVNIPSAPLGPKANGVGAFGRPVVADDARSWRKGPVSPPKADVTIDIPLESGLNTTSRSPPPDVASSQPGVASIPKSAESSPTKAEGNQATLRARSTPKMPAGSGVAVYRDSRIDVIEADPKPLVNFIVTSELVDSKLSSQSATPEPTKSQQPKGSSTEKAHAASSSKPMVNGAKRSPADHLSESSLEQSIPSLTSTKAESKGLDESADVLATAPNHHHASPWARSSLSLSVKDTSARGPDPEHLKAVWSQTSNKAGQHAVNSLEGIADDLTALPFTLQDVKSEDGETPPPSIPPAPSRMSLHEVTRAFQQVPSSSNPPSHRAPLSPPTTTAPVARPTAYAYPQMPPNNMRPAYASYPSPMMSHSPAPGVMYSHPSPVPSRMPVNGPPLYSQPMWMTMSGPPQNPGNMMRPIGSPYPAQLMSYPSPGTPMYGPPPPANMPPNAAQQQNGIQQNRGRGMSMMSPVMQHAGPAMYASSPVLMHAPVMQVPQNHGYMPMPAGRGQPRPENGHPQQHPQPGGHHPPSHGGFNPVPSFVRSTW